MYEIVLAVCTLIADPSKPSEGQIPQIACFDVSAKADGAINHHACMDMAFKLEGDLASDGLISVTQPQCIQFSEG
jgi:hypothetical protein